MIQQKIYPLHKNRSQLAIWRIFLCFPQGEPLNGLRGSWQLKDFFQDIDRPFVHMEIRLDFYLFEFNSLFISKYLKLYAYWNIYKKDKKEKKRKTVTHKQCINQIITCWVAYMSITVLRPCGPFQSPDCYNYPINTRTDPLNKLCHHNLFGCLLLITPVVLQTHSDYTDSWVPSHGWQAQLEDTHKHMGVNGKTSIFLLLGPTGNTIMLDYLPSHFFLSQDIVTILSTQGFHKKKPTKNKSVIRSEGDGRS